MASFHDIFFDSEDAPHRTRKHIATPLRGSTCKRMNMFLRWMVRKDKSGVDFGLWKKIKPSQLLIPLKGVAMCLRVLCGASSESKKVS